ncbi:MAG: peptide-methionine (R)-S-oxide reductase MsrB [Tissierellia bacterium]|nr:peptide-methionine (R)-S-oxide reductase MsrB [Bacillota bacterium]NLK57720.1 peptide-methionine (R)-S-oxide reductase MsrB [Tissierellia bacterium]
MKRKFFFFFLVFFLIACTKEPAPMTEETKETETLAAPEEDRHTIYFAGGCFWGVEAYFSGIPGVLDAVSGYANGTGEASYARVVTGETGYAETVRVEYNRNAVSLPVLTTAYLRIVDPYLINQQGNDIGTQYRTGIYTVNEEDLATVQAILKKQEEKKGIPFVIETERLQSFYDAEPEHQDYLQKNPDGYCHIDTGLAEGPYLPGEWPVYSDSEVKERLTPLQYKVTMEKGTEPAFDNPYDAEYRPGIYVDIINGRPLFSSDDKFDSGTGWPSFTKGITPDAFTLEEDHSLGMRRIAVSAKESRAHLGHVFPDGPKDKGGLRFCMNSAALRFIPLEEMEKEGYGDFIPWIETR